MPNAFTEELKRPATLVASGLAIISIIFSVLISLYFYQRSIIQGRVYYNVQQVQIFDSDNIKSKKDDPDRITLHDSDGNKISESVFAARIVVWNAGNGEIRNEDIRVPYHLVFSREVRLFSTNITTQTKETYDKFDIKSGNTLTWDHFDPGGAVAIRVLYSSKDVSAIDIEGVSAGITAPQFVSILENMRTPSEKIVAAIPNWFRKLMIFTAIFFLFITGAFLVTIDCWLYAYNHKDDPNLFRSSLRQLKRRRLVAAIFSLIPVIILQLINLINFTPVVPLQ